MVEETLGPSTKLVKKVSPLLSNSDSNDSYVQESFSWEEFVGKEVGSEGEDEDGSRGKKCEGSFQKDINENRLFIFKEVSTEVRDVAIFK